MDKDSFDEERDEDNENSGIYSEEEREELMEDEDEITDIDEGFMKGYNESPDKLRCASCKIKLDGHETIEKEVKGKEYRFCSQHCLTEFEINNEEEN